MKTSVISKEFKDQYLSNPKHPNVFECKAIVFEGRGLSKDSMIKN